MDETYEELLSIQKRLVKLYDSAPIKDAKIRIGNFNHNAHNDIAGAMDCVSSAIWTYREINKPPSKYDLDCMAGDLKAKEWRE